LAEISAIQVFSSFEIYNLFCTGTYILTKLENVEMAIAADQKRFSIEEMFRDFQVAIILRGLSWKQNGSLN